MSYFNKVLSQTSEGWLEKPLSEVADVISGYSFKSTDFKETNSIRSIKITNVGVQQFISKDNSLLPEELANNYKRFAIPKGSIVIALTRSIISSGLKVTMVPDEYDGALLNQRVAALIVNQNVMLRHFLFSYLSTKKVIDYVRSNVNTLMQPNLSVNDLKSMLVPTPTIETQRQIVAILDEAFAGISQAFANAEKNLANARELFDSYLNSVFERKGEGWKRVRVDEVCESIVDCINKTAPKVKEPTLFKMIRTTNVRNGNVNLDEVKYVLEKTYIAWTRRQVPKYGDVLLTREAPLGGVGILLTNDTVFLGQRIVSYRADPKVLNNWYLLYAFQSLDIQNQIKKLASGSTVQHMRVPDTKNLEIGLPSLSNQKQIVSQLDSLKQNIQYLEIIYQQKLTALTELKQSILQKAFTGQLTGRN